MLMMFGATGKKGPQQHGIQTLVDALSRCQGMTGHTGGVATMVPLLRYPLLTCQFASPRSHLLEHWIHFLDYYSGTTHKLSTSLVVMVVRTMRAIDTGRAILALLGLDVAYD